MKNLLKQEQLEKTVKEIIWTLDKMIERGEKYSEAYGVLVSKLERTEKEITVIKKANGVY